MTEVASAMQNTTCPLGEHFGPSEYSIWTIKQSFPSLQRYHWFAWHSALLCTTEWYTLQVMLLEPSMIRPKNDCLWETDAIIFDSLWCNSLDAPRSFFAFSEILSRETRCWTNGIGRLRQTQALAQPPSSLKRVFTETFYTITILFCVDRFLRLWLLLRLPLLLLSIGCFFGSVGSETVPGSIRCCKINMVGIYSSASMSFL